MRRTTSRTVGGFLRRFPGREPGCLSFERVKYCYGRQVGLNPRQPRKMCQTPSHHEIQRQGEFQLLDVAQLSAETPEIGHFLGQSRLCSPFGLRVGADVGLEQSTTYARRLIVNQGQQSPVQLDDVRHLY